MRGTTWPAGFDECASKCTIHVLVYVWSETSCCKWLKISLEFNFTLWHAEPRYTKLWRYNDLIYVHYYHWRFCQKFNCSKHDATMVSGSQVTVCTCNDYSDSNVLKMGATQCSTGTDCNCEISFWVHFRTSKATWVSYFDDATKGKRRNWQNFTAVPVTFIYDWRHYDHHK